MNSKKEYGAKYVIRQRVLFKDQTAEEVTSQPDRQPTQKDRQQDIHTVRPSGGAGEENHFEDQYSQKSKAKRKADRMIRERIPREEADPIELGLSRRPFLKVVR